MLPDEMDVTSQPHDVRTDSGSVVGREGACLIEAPPSSSAYQPHAGTAFTRPPPSGPRDPLFGQSEDSERSAAYPPLPVSPIKALSSVTGVSAYDRTSYFSQFGLNSYSDYVSHNAGIAPSRVPPPPPPPQSHYPDPHVPHGQTLPPVSFGPAAGGGGLSGTYWPGDGRTHSVLAAAAADPYGQYGGHGVASAYDSYKNAAFLRGTVYGQEAALGLNPARGYFTAAAARASETYQGKGSEERRKVRGAEVGWGGVGCGGGGD